MLDIITLSEHHLYYKQALKRCERCFPAARHVKERRGKPGSPSVPGRAVSLQAGAQASTGWHDALRGCRIVPRFAAYPAGPTML